MATRNRSQPPPVRRIGAKRDEYGNIIEYSADGAALRKTPDGRLEPGQGASVGSTPPSRQDASRAAGGTAFDDREAGFAYRRDAMANIRAQEDANRRLGIAENARFIQDTKQGPQGFETAFMTPYGFVGGRRVESDGATTVGRGGTPGANAGTTVSAPPADPNAFVSYNPAAGRHQVNPQPAAAAPASGVAPTTPPQAATPAQPRDNSVAADVGRAARETAATVVNPRVRSSTGGTASAWNPYENPITAPVTRPVRAAVQTAFDTGRRFLRGFTGN